MGVGDEIMASGFAREAHARNGLPVCICDIHGRIRTHTAWRNIKYIVGRWDRKSPINKIANGPGVRHYIRAKSNTRWFWDEQCAAPPVGELVFSEAERAEACRFDNEMVLLEPNNKVSASPNKDWSFGNWQRLAEILRTEGLRPIQMGAPGVRVLDGVDFFPTHDFRIAAVSLRSLRYAVLPEGGLHHAAAAMGLRAVVIYGGFISPQQTGYKIHTNIFTGGSACGMRVPCKHCQTAMARITPELVVHELLKERSAGDD
jgi:hypothetical protein